MIVAGGALACLEAAGLIHVGVDVEPGYRFHHALLQDAAYGTLVRADRRRLHGAVGTALEELYPERRTDLAPVLGAHFAEAGEDTRALAYFRLAGEEAARKWANAEAVQHYCRALDLARTGAADDAMLVDLHTRRGRAQELTGDYAAALAGYSELVALGEARAAPALQLAGLLGCAKLRMLLSATFDLEEGRRLAHRALALARGLDDRPAEAHALWTLLLSGRSAVDPLRAELIGYGEESLRIARALNLREQMAETLNDLSFIYQSAGQLDRARAYGAEARELWRALGNLPMLADNLTNAAVIHYRACEYAAALALTAESEAVSVTIGNRWGQAYSRLIAGWAQHETGALGAAIQTLETAAQLGEGGFLWATVSAYMTLSHLYRRIGALTWSRQLAEQARDLAEQRFPAARSAARLTLARQWVAAGQVAAARQLIAADRAALAEAAPGTLLWFDAEVAAASGDPAAALAVTQAAIRRRVERATPCTLLEWRCYEGELLWRLGRLDAAAATLAAAQEIAATLGTGLILWRIMAAQAQVAALRADPTAPALAAAAQVQIAAVAASLPADERRAAFLAQPLVQAVLDR